VDSEVGNSIEPLRADHETFKVMMIDEWGKTELH
jgi:hypothetical protein